jgi:hypothetical protein
VPGWSIGGDEEHLAYGVEPDQGHREPACQLVACQDPAGCEELQRTEDEGDPAPCAQIPEHVVRVGDEHVRIGDRGDAVDQVEDAKTISP